jgi:hypothetical protein
MRKVGMQFAAEVLHEPSRGIFEVRHQRITGLLHPGEKLYPAAEGRTPDNHDHR